MIDRHDLGFVFCMSTIMAVTITGFGILMYIASKVDQKHTLERIDYMIERGYTPHTCDGTAP